MNLSNQCISLAQCLLIMIFAVGCKTTFTPGEYFGSSNSKKSAKVIKMDGYIHTTTREAHIDSPRAFYAIANLLMSNPDNLLNIVVYYNGNGELEYRRALVAGAIIKDSLVSHNYPQQRIRYQTKFFVPNNDQIRYPYTRIDFVVKKIK